MKNEIRQLNKLKRSEMKKTEVESKSNDASKLFLESEMYKNADCIMLYMPLGNETDTSNIIKRAYDDKKTVVFPVTDRKSGKISARSVEKDTVFAKGAFSISEPINSELIDLFLIDVVIVPGIAFDENGSRIGFGKGCYDSFLKETAAIKIGYCYNFQICDSINAEEHDVAMDYLITESRIIKCKNK